MQESIHFRPDGGVVSYSGTATTAADGFVSRRVDYRETLLIPLLVALEEGQSIDAAKQADPCKPSEPDSDDDARFLERLDAQTDAFVGRTLTQEARLKGLRVLCRELAKRSSAADRRTLESVVSQHQQGTDAPSRSLANAPDWVKLVDTALRAKVRKDFTGAVTLTADEIEHGRAGATATSQARRWWRLAEISGSERASQRLAYLKIRAGDWAAAMEARELCIEILHGRTDRAQDLVRLSKTTLLALESALILKDGELASLVLSHLAHADLISTDEDKLTKLRELVMAHHARLRDAPAAPDRVRVIQSYVPAEGRDNEVLNRLGVLLTPLLLAPWPADTAWADTLDAEFPWLSAVTADLRAQATMRTQMGGQAFQISPLLLLGGVGIGKTRYQRRLGELTGVPSMLHSLAGSMDNMALKGNARGWSSARPGIILEFMANRACPNPIVLLDEIDKAGHGTRNGNVWNTLLGMLERSTAARLQDEFVLGEVDYSHVNWLATANDIRHMPSPLRSRLKIIEVKGPRPAHFDIVIRNLLHETAMEMGVHVAMLPQLDPCLIDAMRASFRRAPNLRVLARVLRDTLARAATDRPGPLQ